MYLQLHKGPLFSAVKSHVALQSTAVRPVKPLTRALSSSVSSLQPHLPTPLHQQEKVHPPPQVEARPYSEIPKTKTFLGLNVEMIKDANQMGKYFKKQGDELGSIFRVTGVPSIPEQVCVLDPKDVETAFRVGDNTYPRRFPFIDWINARKELNLPLGMFLE